MSDRAKTINKTDMIDRTKKKMTDRTEKPVKIYRADRADRLDRTVILDRSDRTY